MQSGKWQKYPSIQIRYSALFYKICREIHQPLFIYNFVGETYIVFSILESAILIPIAGSHKFIENKLQLLIINKHHFQQGKETPRAKFVNLIIKLQWFCV